jgi:hypothetical protein
MNSTVFWVVTMCISEEARRFGATSPPSSGSKRKPSTRKSCGKLSSSTLKMKAICSSEMLGFFRTKRSYNSKDRSVHERFVSHRFEFIIHIHHYIRRHIINAVEIMSLNKRRYWLHSGDFEGRTLFAKLLFICFYGGCVNSYKFRSWIAPFNPLNYNDNYSAYTTRCNIKRILCFSHRVNLRVSQVSQNKQVLFL